MSENGSTETQRRARAPGLCSALAGMTQNPEFAGNGLEDFLGMGFLPVEPAKLEQAIEEIRNLIVWKE